MGFIKLIGWIAYFLIYASFAAAWACHGGRDIFNAHTTLQHIFDAILLVTGFPLFMQFQAAEYRNNKRNFFRKYGHD